MTWMTSKNLCSTALAKDEAKFGKVCFWGRHGQISGFYGLEKGNRGQTEKRSNQ